MSKNPQLAVPAGPQVPDNATFIGAWDRDCGVDIFYEALYLTRGNEQDFAGVTPRLFQEYNLPQEPSSPGVVRARGSDTAFG